METFNSPLIQGVTTWEYISVFLLTRCVNQHKTPTLFKRAVVRIHIHDYTKQYTVVPGVPWYWENLINRASGMSLQET